MKHLKNKNIILFDGICNLCNSSVQFIIKHDKKQRFLFTSLQSDAARELLLQFPSKKNKMNSLLYIENNKIYDKSNAALQIIKHLNTPLNWLFTFVIIPKTVRDYLYNFIAKNRYKWFGKKECCMIPSPELKERFLT